MEGASRNIVLFAYLVRYETVILLSGCKNKILYFTDKKEICEYFEIPYMTETDWELGNRRVPQYLLRLMEYKVEMERLCDKRNKDDKEDK